MMNFFNLSGMPVRHPMIGQQVAVLRGDKWLGGGNLHFIGVCPLDAFLGRDRITITVGRTPLTFSRHQFKHIKIKQHEAL